MKKGLFYFIFVLVMGVTFGCKKNAADKVEDIEAAKAKERARLEKIGFPEMTFENREFEFGTVNEGDIVTGSFTFVNTGKSDLVITSAHSSCGCTIPEYERNKAIKKGEEGTIEFKFNTNGKPENQLKTITLETNTKNQIEKLVIKGYVTPKKIVTQ